MKLDGHTKLTGLLGSPVAHSISPLMHNEAFRLLDINYAYLCFDVGTENLKTAVDGLRTIGVRGFNCTMPDKNLMCELADELSQAAALIGAVNTVVNDNGKLTGYNTDGIGYMRSLRDGGCQVAGEKMTLLGAGGAAVSIAVQAALDGVRELDIFSRKGKNWERISRLCNELNEKTSCHVSLYEMEDGTQMKKSLLESRLLTNATSVGMEGNPVKTLIHDKKMFHEGLFVSDIIYNPRKTVLLQQAEEAGCQTMNGLYMLLYQGAEAFSLWTGQEMPVEEIKKKYFAE